MKSFARTHVRLKRVACAVAFTAALLVSVAAHAASGVEAEVRALYEKFYTAQNARDLAAVGDLLLESPQFLWVSDGQSVWGKGPTLERMAAFQTLAVWRVTPDPAAGTVIDLADGAAAFHLPLALALGEDAASARTYRFLVTMLARRTPAGWRIAALLTTTQKAP